MLHLLQSNKMEQLASALCECLSLPSPGQALFAEDVILVQSPGMAQWLKLQIADSQGIAANLDFPLPSSFIWNLYRAFIPDLPEQSAFTKDNMAWKLFHLLPKLSQRPEFADILHYLKQHKEGQSELSPFKTYQLSLKIADVYDQYLMYRPQWLSLWESGQDLLADTDVSQHTWQPILWRELLAYSQQLQESPLHRANLHHRLLQQLQQDDPQILEDVKAKLPPALYVFGISAMPEQQLQILQAMALHIEVYIFWFNPSCHYWGDIVDEKRKAKLKLQQADQDVKEADYLDTGNPLLASWGKLGRDYQDMLLALDLEQHDLFQDIDDHSMLANIQQQVLELEFRGSMQMLAPQELLSNGLEFPKIEIPSTDTSLVFQSCHSPIRELEVLQDRLLSLFQRDPKLLPGDVIVMMPDVSSYAPYIEAVFNGTDEKHKLPFAISDRNVSQESPLLQSFVQLMQLHQSRFNLSQILDIFAVPAVLRQFDCGEGELDKLQHWLQDVGIRWAIDAEHKAHWQLPTEQQNSWWFGLQRLLAGYALGQDDLYQGAEDSIAPYLNFEGQDTQALGKFYLFFRQLLAVREFCQQDMSLTDKISGALSLLETIYLGDEADEPYLLELRQALEQLLKHQAQYPDVIEQDIFVHSLEANLSQKGVGQRFLAGAINFCTLMPMRSIPFKHVCLLGMNDGEYPRQVVPIGFDLMRSANAKRGDRSRRLDDRYLFLEALLSARDSLYMSYLGRSSKDNSPKMPSILIGELMDYCLDSFALDGELSLPVTQTKANLLQHLVKQAALQPFNPQYFAGDSACSYQSLWLEVASSQQLPVKSKVFWQQALEPLAVPETLDLEQFCRFFENPAKAFFIQRWQTAFLRLQQDNPQQEPFSLDALDKYQLNSRLVEQFELSTETLKAEGILPLGKVADINLRPVQQQSEQLKAKLVEYQGEHGSGAKEIYLQMGETKLEGWLEGIYGRRLIRWRPGKIRAKDRFNLWLQWLMLSAQGISLSQAVFIGTDGEFVLPEIKSQPARQYLELYLSYWQQGLTSPLLFFPEAAWVWLKTSDQNKTLQSFNGNMFAAGEGQELHIQRICPDLSTVFEPFSELAQTLMGPLWQQQEAADE